LVPIRLREVAVHVVDMPLIRTFRTAHGTTTAKQTLIVRAQDSQGVVGWGEAPASDLPLYSPDTLDASWYALTKLLAPLVVGHGFEGPRQLAAAWSRYQGYNFAKHALECAAWTIASVKLGAPLSALVGGERAAVPVGESFGIEESLDDLLREIEERLRQGFCRVKVKIEPGWDLDVLRAVVRAFPELPVMADGNCGYDPRLGGPWEELDELRLLMLEQPFPAEALVELANLQSRLTTPVCLDESAVTPGLTAAALRMGAGRIVNVKPPRLGGISACLAVHEDARGLDVPLWCGGLLESGIGRGANLAIASLPGFTLPADMSPARLFYAEDLVEPTFDVCADGTVAVPDQPGVGFPVVEERVMKYRSAVEVVR
jgi:O-succinylbenzoate synthase